MTIHPSLIFALCSAVSFAIASVLFAIYSKKFSALWMGAFKAIIAFIFFGVFTFLEIGIEIFSILKPNLSHLFWFTSGFIGLAFGDWALLKGFVRLGAARTLMIFSFSPIVLSIGGYIFFDQLMSIKQISAIFLMILCVMCLSFEKYKESGKWEITGFAFAFIGVFCDDLGIILSRAAFDRLPEATSFFANWVRTIGSLVGFYIIHIIFVRIPLRSLYFSLTKKQKISLIIACVFGTFLSLSFWLYAVKIGHLASIAAIGMTGPLFATLFESMYERKKPSLYLCISLFLFISGIVIMHH